MIPIVLFINSFQMNVLMSTKTRANILNRQLRQLNFFFQFSDNKRAQPMRHNFSTFYDRTK